MASALIGSLRVALGLDTATFETGARKASTIARQRAGEMEGAFKSARHAAEGLFAAFAIGALAEQVKKSLEYAGSIAEVARTLGVTTAQLQEYRFAAGQTGVAQEQLELGLRKLTQSMGQAEAGASKQIKAFGAIGISLDQLKGKNTGEVFKTVADGLEKIPDRAQRAAVEVALFGRSGSMLDNLLSGGSARINELSEAAKTLGIVLSDEQIQGAEETAHKLEAVKTVLEAQIAGVVATNANAILSLSSALATLTGEIVRFLGSNPQLALTIIGALAGGRIGGLPGAAAGAVAGYVLGGNVARSAADGNPDLKFRTDQMRAAQKRYNDSLHATTDYIMDDSGMRVAMPGKSAAGSASLKAEFIRQIDLLKGATAQAHAQAAPRPGTTVPQFLAGKSPGAAKKTPQDRTEQDEFLFAQQDRQTDMQILEAKKQLAHNTGDQADLSLQILDIQNEMRIAEIDHRVAQAQRDFADKKISASTLAQIESQAGIEKAKQAELNKLEHQAVLDDRDRQLVADQEAIDSQYLDLKKELLQKQADLVDTAEERRRIELSILDIAERQERKALEDLIASNRNDVEVEQARNALRLLGPKYELERQGVMKSTQGPMEQYLAQLPTTAAKAEEALERLETQGFDGLIDGVLALTDGLAAGSKSLLQTVKSFLLGIARIQLQQSLGSLVGNGTGITNLFKSLVGATGQNSLGPSLFPVVNGVDPLAPLPHLARGGSFRILGNSGVDKNVLSLNNMPIANVSMGEHLTVANDRGSPGGGGGRGDTIMNITTPDAESFRRSRGQITRSIKRSLR